MRSNIEFGKVWGIPLYLHWSWFLIFALLTWSLAVGYFPTKLTTSNPAILWAEAIVTAILFFGSVLLHELGHTFIALRNRLAVNRITMFIFGGVAEIAEEPDTPGAEFRIAIAGPAVSLILSLIFFSLGLITLSIPILSVPALLLGSVNLSLAIFNLIPGFPLDGGRVFRALVWKVTGDQFRATRYSVFTGQLAAFGLSMLGVYYVVMGNVANGIWLFFIGWFLQNAAASSGTQSSLQHLLEGVKVFQVMSRNFPWVTRNDSLAELVFNHVLNGGARRFLVANKGELCGLLTLSDVKNIPNFRWKFVTADDVMTPIDRFIKVSPTTDLKVALELMEGSKVQQLPVMQEENLVGLITREDAINYLRARTELGV